MTNYDCVLVSAPALLAGLAGYGFARLEEKKNFPSRCIGFLGLRVSVITFQVASLATVIYAVFRSTLLNIINTLTFKKINCLRVHAIRNDEYIKVLFGGTSKKPPMGGPA